MRAPLFQKGVHGGRAPAQVQRELFRCGAGPDSSAPGTLIGPRSSAVLLRWFALIRISFPTPDFVGVHTLAAVR